jgi:putative DNA primase/helicase
LAWHLWCDDNGHVPGSAADFGRKLRAVIPRVGDVRKKVEGRRERHYTGLNLSPEARTDIINRRLGA